MDAKRWLDPKLGQYLILVRLRISKMLTFARMSGEKGAAHVPVNTNASRCRICESIMAQWPKEWLGFRWGTCRSCGSVQKLIGNLEFKALSPSYDPGFLDDATDLDSLQKSMGVNEKYLLLSKLLGPNVDGSLLDIGCGMGGFLLAGKKMGMTVSGVEPSVSHSRAAVDIFGLDVKCCYFKSGEYDKKFDVVVLSHVIEHIFEPGVFVADVMKVLQPGGRLIVITPNCGSLGASVCGKYWSMYKPIDHVTMFTKNAIERTIPADADIETLSTSEWPGEFAAHLISGCKTAIKPSLSNIAPSIAAPCGAAGSVRQSTLGPVVRLILALISLPFYMLGLVIDRQSCIYAVIQKRVTG